MVPFRYCQDFSLDMYSLIILVNKPKAYICLGLFYILVQIKGVAFEISYAAGLIMSERIRLLA